MNRRSEVTIAAPSIASASGQSGEAATGASMVHVRVEFSTARREIGECVRDLGIGTDSRGNGCLDCPKVCAMIVRSDPEGPCTRKGGIGAHNSVAKRFVSARSPLRSAQQFNALGVSAVAKMSNCPQIGLRGQNRLTFGVQGVASVGLQSVPLLGRESVGYSGPGSLRIPRSRRPVAHEQWSLKHGIDLTINVRRAARRRRHGAAQ